MYCFICKKYFNYDSSNFSKIHLKRYHNIETKDYYDTFIRYENEGICKHHNCSNETTFIGIKTGYRDYCCKNCFNTSKRRKNKIKATNDLKTNEEKLKIVNKRKVTNKIRYGDENYMCFGSNSFKNNLNEKYGNPNYNNWEKSKNTRKERYGDENYGLYGSYYFQQLMFVKYGVRYYSQFEKYNDQKRNTLNDKYGDPTYNNRSKAKNTNIQKYGVCHPMQSPIIYNKFENSMIKNYGFDHPARVPEIAEKMTGYLWHNYQLPSGNWIKLQGYEPFVLDQLLLNYNEEDILYKKTDVPEIWYLWKDKSKHRYYPDFYIPKDNLIIEVKSWFTYLKELCKNKLKKQASEELGYNFKFIILDIKLNIIKEEELENENI